MDTPISGLLKNISFGMLRGSYVPNLMTIGPKLGSQCRRVDGHRMDRHRMDGHRTDAKVILYSVPCCTLHWTDNILYSVHSWARTHGAQLSAGYTVNTYSKPPLYDAIAQTDTLTRDRRQTQLTTNQPASQSGSTQLKAGKCCTLHWTHNKVEKLEVLQLEVLAGLGSRIFFMGIN